MCHARGECLVAGCRSGKCRGSWADVEKRVATKAWVQSGVSIDFGKQPISFVRNESPRRSERSSDSIGCLVRTTNRVIARLTESKIRSRRVGPHRIVHVCFPPWNNRHATIALRFGFCPSTRTPCAHNTHAHEPSEVVAKRVHRTSSTC